MTIDMFIKIDTVEDRLTENVILNFSRVSMDYVSQNDQGSTGTAIPMAWDISANENN
jgi:type VI secretion system secreted protein Hcp